MSVTPKDEVLTKERVEISLWRQPFGEQAGRFQPYALAMTPGDHVLNLLWRLRRLVDPTLVFPDHYCKVGTCGACALTVDGRPALACRTLVRDGIAIAPPKGRTVVADLLTSIRRSDQETVA